MLHNLAIIIYFELKSHNKLINYIISGKTNIEQNKSNFFAKRNELLDNMIISDEDRLERKLSKQERELLHKEKEELENYRLSDNEIQNNFLKKEMALLTQDIKDKEKIFLETSKFFSKNKNNLQSFGYTHLFEEEMKGSKLPKNEKVDVMMHNIEIVDVNSEATKIIQKNVDYDNDLDSILPNLFLALKLREMSLDYFDYKNKLENKFNNTVDNSEEFLYLKDNYSADMDIFNFALLYKPFFQFYSSKKMTQPKNITNKHKNENLISKLTSGANKNKNTMTLQNTQYKDQDEFSVFLDSIEKFKNTKLEIIRHIQVEEFKDISEKDKYFTFIKNRYNLPTCVFIAELIAESSSLFPEESEYWIKYALFLSISIHDTCSILRSLVLTAAYLIDKSNHHLSLEKAEIILFYIYDIYNKQKLSSDPFTEIDLNKNISTYAMAIHLLGVIIKSDPKKKGEGLELIQKANEIRKNLKNEERIFYLDFDREYKYDMDYDEETLEYIEKNSKYN